VVRYLSLQRLCWLFAFLVAATFSSIAGAGPEAQAASAQLAFSPSSSSVAVGGNVAVDITVATVSNLGGYDVHLQFNPAIVHVVSMTDSGFVKSGGNIVVCNDATIDNSAGTAIDSCSTVPIFGTPGPGVSTVGATALLHVSFTGVTAGKSSLTLTDSTLEDPDSATSTPAFGTGSIAVTAASVGGVAQLTGVGTLPAQTSRADSSRHPYLLVMLAVGLLAGAAAGAGYAMRRRRS
jgi:hypothetical protein